MESFNNSFLTRFIQDSLPLPQEAIFTVVNLEELNTFLQEGAIKRPLSLMSLLEVTLKKREVRTTLCSLHLQLSGNIRR